MAEIHILSSDTINRIAAGEVVERPVNVVKELAENSIDAGATAITVEIRNGGIDLIRVTDNGCGIDPSQITKAFRRHATSKIAEADDLQCVTSLGFRGEALSSIAAVSRVEMITKTREQVAGIRAVNDVLHSAGSSGSLNDSRSEETALDITEAGAPDGTSVIVRDLFYNVPVRRKFLKSAQTEAGAVTELLEHLALSHPKISFHYRVNGQEKLHTTGNGNIKELIYRIYGREMSNSMLPIAKTSEDTELVINGYLGRPEFSRSSRSHEIFFVNGRILKSDVLSKALEEGYRTDLMQHRFPFAVVYLKVAAENTDVNVHPSKLEIRFADPKRIFDFVNESVHQTLHSTELIPRATLSTRAEEIQLQKSEALQRENAKKAQEHTEPFERVELPDSAALKPKETPQVSQVSALPEKDALRENVTRYEEEDFVFVDKTAAGPASEQKGRYEQQSFIRETDLPDKQQAAQKQREQEQALEAGDLEAMFRESVREDYAEDLYGNRAFHILCASNVPEYKIIGQIFDTYWILSFRDKMLMIDQHAAHEKVHFERLMKRLSGRQGEASASQLLAPPIVLNLTGREEAALEQYRDYFVRMGYEIESFGDNSYALRSVPMELYANEPDVLLREILDEILDSRMSGTPAAILYKIASMSCKAAVKGNMKQSKEEAKALIDELLSLDNPYHCPHGRPTMIVLTRQEIERKFKRIL